MSSTLGNPLVLNLATHYDELLAFVMRRVASRAVAEDIVQDSYLRIAASGSGEVVQNPRAYLFRTASNLVADHWRAAGRQHKPLSAADGLQHLPDARPSPEGHALSLEELAVVENAIAGMPDRMREVFVMHRFGGLSYAQIADELGIAKNTVVVHMMRAMAHCQREVSRYRSGEG